MKENIRLGDKYYCLLETKIINDEQAKNDKAECSWTIIYGYVTSKGEQIEGEALAKFVEIAGQRVRTSHVFETAEECVDFAKAVCSEKVKLLKTLPATE